MAQQSKSTEPALCTQETATRLAEDFGTPLYVYNKDVLLKQAEELKLVPNAFGLTPRFAVKAASTRAILQILDKAGLHFDASSGYEAQRLLLAGVAPNKISLSAQEWPYNFKELYTMGVKLNACSLTQLQIFGEGIPHGEIGIRINPGIGSGTCNKTTVGGITASFGIWHTYTKNILEIVQKYKIKIVRLHSHIGSGCDSSLWQQAAIRMLEMTKTFSDVTSLNLGGGYKVARIATEEQCDLHSIGEFTYQLFQQFYNETGRKLNLELEPGNFTVANAGCLLAKVLDIVVTGDHGFKFIKLDTGMTEILRPGLYGSQHKIKILTNNKHEKKLSEKFIIVGHCCESGDLLSVLPNKGDMFCELLLPYPTVGDICVIESTGAYCSTMSAINYNSFPAAAEIIICNQDEPKLIRKRQTIEQMLVNEI